MIIGEIAKQAKQLVSDNSAVILTAMGVTGALTSVYLTAKATFKSADDISKAQAAHDLEEKSHPLDNREKAELVWQNYIPAAASTIMTVVAIVGANHISSRRAAALASAYSFSEKAFDQYKKHVVATVGEKKEQAVRTAVAQDQINNTDMPSLVVVEGKVRCYDSYSGRYFDCTPNEIDKAVNDTNWQILNDGSASLTDFWGRIGLDQTAASDDLGWNTDKQLELVKTAGLEKSSIPVLDLTFRTVPIPRYYRSSY